MMIAILKMPDGGRIWFRRDKNWVPLDDKALARLIPRYKELNENARRKYVERLVGSCVIKKRARADAFLSNAKPPRSAEAAENGTAAFLKLTSLFEDPRAGYIIAAYLVAGLRAHALMRCAPNVRFAISIADRSAQVADIVTTIVKTVVTRKHWHGKHCRIRRKAVIDCRCVDSFVGINFGDKSAVTVAGHTQCTAPFPYVDTAACIFSADGAFLREADAYMREAFVVLVGCGSNDWGAARLSARELAAYDPRVLQTMQEHRREIAGVLRAWWQGAEDEARWAAEIVAAAKVSFGKKDDKYVAVMLDPKKFRDAIAYRVLLSFLDFAVAQNWLNADAADAHRAAAQTVFEPAPAEVKPARRMEEPEVFRELMMEMMRDPSSKILPLGARYVKTDGALGAIRKIGEERFLVMLEPVWSRTYLKTAKAAGVDCSYAQRPNWARDLQKVLGEAGAIKMPSAGYRYRYDLMGNGTRDSTYVVAFPLDD